MPTPASPAATSASKQVSALAGALALAGAALTVLGVFSGWVTLTAGGRGETVTAWSLTTGSGVLRSDDPYLLLGLACAAGLVGVLYLAGVARTLVRVASAAVGVGIVTVAALNWISISDFVTDNFSTTFTAETALGFYLVVAGGIVTALAAAMPAKK